MQHHITSNGNILLSVFNN